MSESEIDCDECTIMGCSETAEFAYWMPDLGQFSKVRNPEHVLMEDGDLAPYVCESCRDRMASSPHWDGDRFARLTEKLVTDGGEPQHQPAIERCNVCGGDAAEHILVVRIESVLGGDVWVYDDGFARVVPWVTQHERLDPTNSLEDRQ